MPFAADHIASKDGGFEPQRMDNFIVEIYNLPGATQDTVQLAIQSTSLPTVSFEEMEIPFGNERVWVAGKVSQDSIPLVLRDYIDHPLRDIIERWSRQVWDPITGKMGRAADYKKEGRWIITGPDEENERQYIVQGIWPQTINPGSLDMGSSDQVQPELTLRYDKAYLLL